MTTTAILRDEVIAAVTAGEAVERDVPGGRLFLDRPLPFLCVHRQLPDQLEVGFDTLCAAEAAHLIVKGDEATGAWIQDLVEGLAHWSTERFGSFLALEVWSAGSPPAGPPVIRVLTSSKGETSATAKALNDALGDALLAGREVTAALVPTAQIAPPALDPVLGETCVRVEGAVLLGVEVPAVLHDPSTRRPYPVALRDARRALAPAFRRTFFEFMQTQTDEPVADFRVLGSHRMDATGRDADEELAAIADDLGFLLAVTPVNGPEAWEEFVASAHRAAPRFHYRPLSIDPDVVKRRLYALPLEDVADPVLGALLRAKRTEVDRMVSMLADRDGPEFLLGSLQLYGPVDPVLVETAINLLSSVTGRLGPPASWDPVESVNAHAFADRVRAEIAAYRLALPSLDARVEVRDDVATLQVDAGRVFVPSTMGVASARVEALVHHEVGTHVITHANGSAQPLRLLGVGLPGAAFTQEGLAVFAEYVCGGMTAGRLCHVAARVIAADAVARGLPFADAFHALHEGHGLSRAGAFRLLVRTYRSGGLTKDAGYLSGLTGVLAHVAGGGELEPLLAGKVGIDHLAVVEDLVWRGLVRPPVLRPRWLDVDGSRERLDRVRQGLTVLDLASEVPA